jgi:hypothetical protein
MGPTTQTGDSHILAGVSGFCVGIAAQMLLQYVLTRFVGPIPAFWSRQMLLLAIILLTPPILSYRFWTVDEGSPQETFARWLQLGALFWFLKVVFSLFV